MSDIQTEPAVEKLLEYAKLKKSITYDEINDLLPDNVVNSEKIEEVIAILEKNKIKIIEDAATSQAPPEDMDDMLDDEADELPDTDLEDSEEEEPAEVEVDEPVEKKRIVYNEKETSIDDPIRLYLREIGKENLLTAEQEVELSKQMEEGENIIKEILSLIHI